MKTLPQRLHNWWTPSEIEQRRSGWLWASKADLSDEEVGAILLDWGEPFDQGARDFFCGHPMPKGDQ